MRTIERKSKSSNHRANGESGCSRRDFLMRGSGGLAALALAGRGGLGFAAGFQASEPHMEFPTDPRARLAVASYPFRDFVQSNFSRRRNPQKPGMDLPAFARMVVERFNVNGIEPWSPHFVSRTPADLAALRAAFDKAGVHVVNIPCDLRESVYDPDAAQRKAAVEAGKGWVDTAVAVGSPGIRVHVGRARNAAPDVALAAASLTQIADYGAQHNVVITLENDDLVSEDAFFIVRVLDRANHPWLHALPDFGNSAMTGEPAFNLDALTVMFRHAYNISHVKDSEAGDNGQIVNADVPAAFKIAHASGYRGYFSMEMDKPGDPYEGTASLIAQSLKELTIAD
ncbi:MAG TPA: sugar phosphate isomerase/epimerase family protein [Terriglobia bacterium]|nr:sugar phosphate isomerase/epimerase family protein [Terriglobia bacterium]